MEPIYPDILAHISWKEHGCDHFPPVLKKQYLTEFPGVCDTADRHGNIYTHPLMLGLE